jgi:hypothetical protein
LIVQGTAEKRDHFEVLIEDSNKKEVELTISLDGKIVE